MVEGLSVYQVLEGVYNFLKDLGGKEITLPFQVRVEIANDSDWHRTRVGYMIYEKVLMLRVDGREWAVVLGKSAVTSQ